MNLLNNIKNGFNIIKNYNYKSIPGNLHRKFQELISYLIFDKNWYFLEYIISLLATIEMEFPLIFDEEFRKDCNTSDTVWVNPPQAEDMSLAQRTIPKNTFYCEGCYFSGYSKIARFFLGSQCDGYCYYLGKGDFSYLRPTDLLWDGCKCCGINEDMEDWEEYNDEL